ncbi:hypothetical protein Avbf_10433 [Armadillidium vulgare]|nr:hypothetical protein Avbf_10433 [Armadillidium vulgare]
MYQIRHYKHCYFRQLLKLENGARSRMKHLLKIHLSLHQCLLILSTMKRLLNLNFDEMEKCLEKFPSFIDEATIESDDD